MKIKDISIDEIIYAFKTFEKRIDICRYFGCKQSQTRFIKALCEKANINPDDYIAPVKESVLMRGKCKLCGKEIIYPKNENRKFCSHTCSAIYNNTKRSNRALSDAKRILGENATDEDIEKFSVKLLLNKEKNYCLNCGKEIEYKASEKGKFCCQQCQFDYKYKRYIKSWKEGNELGYRGVGQISAHLRRYMLEKTNCSCEICGCNWVNPKSGKPIVEIHHKDGNPYNNVESNLQVLCPNHHAMTETYKNNNKENGRKNRNKK